MSFNRSSQFIFYNLFFQPILILYLAINLISTDYVCDIIPRRSHFSFLHTFYIAFKRSALCPKARINTPLSLPLLAFMQQTTLIARSCGSTLDRPACLGDASRK